MVGREAVGGGDEDVICGDVVRRGHECYKGRSGIELWVVALVEVELEIYFFVCRHPVRSCNGPVDADQVRGLGNFVEL